MPLIRLAPAFLALALWAGGAAAQISFAPAVNYSTGAGTAPRGVVAGDFNGDGKLDLVTANFFPNNVTVLLGNGNGTFGLPQGFAVGVQPAIMAAGDVNRDGKLDLVVANLGSNTISLLLGNGDGTFAPQVVIPTPGLPRWVLLADFNGDGKLDLAFTNQTANNLSIRLGNGDGTFSAAQSAPTGLGAEALAVGDMNGDGKLDVALTNVTAGTVSTFLGNGDGTFAPRQDFAAKPLATEVVMRDFNGDGKLDVAVANNSTGLISIMLGNGDGTLQPQLTFPVTSASLYLVPGDFDRDGKVDLVTSYDAPDNQAGVLRGNGDGTFGTAAGFGVGSQATQVAVGDFDGDGRPDIAVANFSSNDISILINTTPVLPTAPTGAIATVGNARLTVAFAPPADAASLPILDYTATCGAISATATASPVVVAPLVNGTAYTCTVKARNVAGSSVAGAPSGSATPISPSAVALATSGSPSIINAAVIFTATVTGDNPGGTVAFKDGGTTLTGCGAVALAAGTAQCIAAFFTTGTKTITADYSGNAANLPSTGTLAGGQVVNPFTASVALATSASPAALNASVTFTATVAGTAPTGTVNFKNGGATIAGCGAAVVATNLAQCTTSFATPGTKAITGDYSGDGSNTPATGTLAGGQGINPATAGVVLATSASPVLVNAPVTFTATVTGLVPTGTVNFKSGGTTITGCGAVVLAATVAQCAASFATAGTRAITADYSGDGSNLPANATLAGGQVVNLATSTVALSSSPSPSFVGVPVTIVAIVTGNTPTGTIAFQDGAASIAGCAAVSVSGGGVAQCFTTFATPGTKAITATYSGDAANATSTGTLLGGHVVVLPMTSFTGQTATGTGTATVAFTGGGPACAFAPQGNGAMQSAFFIALTGHPKSPPTGSAPGIVQFPHGLLDFVLVDCTQGSTITYTVTYPVALPPGTQYWKYGPRPGSPTPAWYVLPATIAGNTATFSITDGGLGDDDLTVNGFIVDQGGPGVPSGTVALPVPTLSEWAMALLALMLAGFGASRVRMPRRM